MSKIVIHTDDLPKWAVRKQKLPYSYLDHLLEAAHPSRDGKRMISLEEVMMRQHFDAAIKGNSKAIGWLLRKIIGENAAELATCESRPFVQIQGSHNFHPLAPVLATLGCITVRKPKQGAGGVERIELAPWFEAALERRCPVEKLKPVKAWLEAGGEQKPRNPDPDRCD